jgi:hypothetical protein
LKRLIFYLQYAWRNLRGSRRWTTFAILSVAAGVATVVALRSLGLAIGDSLLVNLRELNRGDITIRTVGGGFFQFAVNQGDAEGRIFLPWQIDQIANLTERYNGQMTLYSSYNNVQVTALDAAETGRPQFINTLFIDPQTFAIARDIRMIDPLDVPLADIFTGGLQVVVSENLAKAADLHVGDPVRVTGTTEIFTVVGIVPTDIEANIRNVTASFFGFAYFPAEVAPLMQLNDDPNAISIVLPDGTPAATIRELGLELWRSGVGIFSMDTTPDLL